MEEDVLGTRQDVIGEQYTRCSRCGTVIQMQEAHLLPTEGTEELGVATERLELCDECTRELESGEGVWPTEEPDELA